MKEKKETGKRKEREAKGIDEDEFTGAKQYRSLPKTVAEKESAKRLIVVLERASLETVKAGQSYQLLNCDDHKHIMKKAGREAASMRPDITHQCLLMLLDSPLNKAGLLQVYIHSEKNVLIEVHPSIRIPRTYKRFSGLMVQLLHKLKIRAVNGPECLLKVIKNPVNIHLPPIARKFGTAQEGKLIEPNAWAKGLPENEPVVVVIGALSHGDVPADYIEETIAVSEYPLSAAVTCSKICSAFERKWGVL